eukprot:TRINITY_DN2396_c0_g1_i2.p1 TRINITY_DN2396_c0_g1~~TRINITY_DN2396_c0_g1_i2.p1  ORF type:complete len:1163 (+),score=477.56 TRINITY_DN2396_c0_g1_i2:89-3577(+)
MGRGEKSRASENVRVVVRVRPLSQQESHRGERDIVNLNIPAGVVVTPREHSEEPKTWHFNAVYNNSFTQRDIFREEAVPLIDYVFQGYNATIFAYGQSGSGKTYTMSGHHDSDPGILPQTLQYFFEKLKESTKLEPKKTFTLRLVFVEIYQDKVSDLLDPHTTQVPIRLSGNTFDVPQATQRVLNSTEEAMSSFDAGSSKRHVASHALNDRSSRSHTLFVLKLETIDNEIPEAPKRVVSKFNLVDLAGSERQSKTGSTGETLAEGAKINSSLLALGCCIDAIIKGDFIPYRSTSLTMLLKDSLGGNAKTLMFATISPSSGNISETNSTLGFAARAKKIKNEPHKNLDPKDALIAQLKERIAALEGQLGLGPEQSSAIEELNADMAKIKLELQEARADAESRSEKFQSILAAKDECIAEMQRRSEEQRDTEMDQLQRALRSERRQLAELRGLVEAHLKVSLTEDQLLPREGRQWEFDAIRQMLRLAEEQCFAARRAADQSEALLRRESELQHKDSALQKALSQQQDAETALEKAEAEVRHLRCELAQVEGRAGDAASELKGETERVERQDKKILELQRLLTKARAEVEGLEQTKASLDSELGQLKQENKRLLAGNREELRQQVEIMSALASSPGAQLPVARDDSGTPQPPAGPVQQPRYQRSRTGSTCSVDAAAAGPHPDGRATPAAPADGGEQQPAAPLPPPTSPDPPPGGTAPLWRAHGGGTYEGTVPDAAAIAQVVEQLRQQMLTAKAESDEALRKQAEAEHRLATAAAHERATEQRLQREFRDQVADLEEKLLLVAEKRQQDKTKNTRLKQTVKQLQQELEDALRRSWSEKEAMKAEIELARRERTESVQSLEVVSTRQREDAESLRRLAAEREQLALVAQAKTSELAQSESRLRQMQEQVALWKQRAEEAHQQCREFEKEFNQRAQELKEEKLAEEANLIAQHRQVLEEREVVHKKKTSKLRREINALKDSIDDIKRECQSQVDAAMHERDAERVRAQTYQQLIEEEKAKLLRAKMTPEEREREDWDRRQQQMRGDMRRQAEQRSLGVKALLDGGGREADVRPARAAEHPLSAGGTREPLAATPPTGNGIASPQGYSGAPLGSAGREARGSAGREARGSAGREARRTGSGDIRAAEATARERAADGALRRATTMPIQR